MRNLRVELNAEELLFLVSYRSVRARLRLCQLYKVFTQPADLVAMACPNRRRIRQARKQIAFIEYG